MKKSTNSAAPKASTAKKVCRLNAFGLLSFSASMFFPIPEWLVAAELIAVGVMAVTLILAWRGEFTQ